MRREPCDTIPISKMDTDEQGLHRYLEIMTRPYEDFRLLAEEENNQQEEEK
jgi:hypothetical protein